MSPVAQARDLASTSWLVDAIVYSDVNRPVKVGHRQQRLRGLNQMRRRLARGIELVQRVDRQELAAGARVDPLARHFLEHLRHRVVGAMVAVVIGIFEQVALLADEAVIASPGVDADALERCARHTTQAAGHLQPQAQHVPAQRPVDAHGLVQEAAHFGQAEDAGTKLTEHRPATVRPQIECQITTAHDVPLSKW
jgi:hypothetical protein